MGEVPVFLIVYWAWKPESQVEVLVKVAVAVAARAGEAMATRAATGRRRAARAAVVLRLKALDGVVALRSAVLKGAPRVRGWKEPAPPGERVVTRCHGTLTALPGE
ncbi:hypothetical protein GCM10012280_43530 [Wenjunlia tyrosinilytica]|uniref:Uncharacterized protein n=1 Tax=Wenjunlia tyrosinilytica TaxID=1544741 RepID=A0A918DZW4_9ACTN|nr:hypothetical protein GCM10012280_43530 [Wenjunlia tyrosinilytica]